MARAARSLGSAERLQDTCRDQRFNARRCGTAALARNQSEQQNRLATIPVGDRSVICPNANPTRYDVSELHLGRAGESRPISGMEGT